MSSDEERNYELIKYRTRLIKFLGRPKPIIFRNDHLPCPLISICNVLLLRNDVRLLAVESLETGEVTQKELLSIVEDQLRNTISIENDVTRIIDLLPKLLTSIDVNIKFGSINDFESKPELEIFHLLKIPLYHGWIVSPQDFDTYKAIVETSYYYSPNNDYLKFGQGDVEENVALLKALHLSQYEKCESHLGNKECKAQESMYEEKRAEEGTPIAALTPLPVDLIRNCITSNANQLTPYGLYHLQKSLEELQLCVFFRYNQFSPMLKCRGELLLLATDEYSLDQPEAVWKKLVLNDDSPIVAFDVWDEANYLTDIIEYFANTGNVFDLDPDLQINSDFQMARTLQEQEFEEEACLQSYIESLAATGLQELAQEPPT